MRIDLQPISCQRCGHTWFPRIADVKLCPKCRSARFDQASAPVSDSKPTRTKSSGRWRLCTWCRAFVPSTSIPRPSGQRPFNFRQRCPKCGAVGKMILVPYGPARVLLRCESGGYRIRWNDNDKLSVKPMPPDDMKQAIVRNKSALKVLLEQIGYEFVGKGSADATPR